MFSSTSTSDTSPVAISISLKGGIAMTEAGLDKLGEIVNMLRRLRVAKVKAIRAKTDLGRVTNEGRRITVTMFRIIGDQRAAERKAEAKCRKAKADERAESQAMFANVMGMGQMFDTF